MTGGGNSQGLMGLPGMTRSPAATRNTDGRSCSRWGSAGEVLTILASAKLCMAAIMARIMSSMCTTLAKPMLNPILGRKLVSQRVHIDLVLFV